MKNGGRDVYMVSGGVTKFTKSNPAMDFRLRTKKAFDYALNDIGISVKDIDGSVASYFSDHFQRQLMSGIMAQDYLALTPKPSKRVEGGGATGGLAFQTGVEEVASGRMDVCAVYGFETMSHVNTWKGNEFIALASDTNFDYPVGGFYTGYYAMMAVRHMHEFGTTVEQLAKVSVKNHGNAIHNPYSQSPMKITVEDVRNSQMVSYPLTRLDVCTMSDGAAVAILASEEKAFEMSDHPVKITGIGTGTDTMRLSDRPMLKVPLLANEKESDYKNLKYPGVHSFRAGRSAAIEAYKNAGITDPLEEIDVVELHDAYTSSEIQTYEDLGLCKYGEGGHFVEEGKADINGKVAVNPSGGLLASGHPVGATGIMQSVFMFWQLQHSIKKHFKDDALQVKNAKRGLIHSHAGTGTYVTVSIMEAVK
ncbi:thiolase domain-containing protein [Cuniculiplasma divulgatum]|uniref:propanoyl-CoA C-acyltransferase n=1 Tax=Cuniculiplasma divulgatum TaxID=1673428 RepID=A0A1N5VI02_9ARCH|nr:thiolase domain-containing protein [Cuniculiplasma divulgatum]MCL4320033.1 thiolase domain-containing protein [Candidatus Thermoplasmatota archaeon]WMT49505.1 MAG: thiolase domain-containing protein [Thermoplasmatales archaeon]SIM71805.1 acetyl-CoA C-acetyltransferase [Cuniculiplasma divulgatum]